MRSQMKVIIGRNEWFSIPEYGVDWFRAKIDTGKKNSQLHASAISPFQRDGAQWVSFKTIDEIECEAIVLLEKEAEEGGEKRYFIELSLLSLDEQEHQLLVQLSERGTSRYLLRLGRRALREFLVDSSRSQMLGKF